MDYINFNLITAPTLVEVNGAAKRAVAAVCERGDDQTG